MSSNIAVDQSLLKEAIELGGFKNKKDAINAALREYALRHKQQKIKELFGTIDYEDDYDYKKSRKRQ